MNRLIPLALKGIGLLTMAGGTALGAKSAVDIKSANDLIAESTKKYESAYSDLKAYEESVNAELTNLGEWQEYSIRLVVDRMINFLRRHEKQVNENEKLLVDGLDAAQGQVSVGDAHSQDPVQWMRTVIGSVGTGVGVNRGLLAAMKRLGSASTGTPISSLSGAAKGKALFAAFGGGSKASGGGGIASGKVALNLVTIGPALLVTGLFAASQGFKAKTQANAVEAQANIEIAELEVRRATLDAVTARTRELWWLLDALTKRAHAALEALESAPFDPAIHASAFQQALSLSVAVRDVATTPVVDQAGELNEESAKLKIKYRRLSEEPRNV